MWGGKGFIAFLRFVDWLVSWVLWHINFCRLFKTKAILVEKLLWYYLTYTGGGGKGFIDFLSWLVGWLVGWIYGISTFVGYLMQNPFLCK